MKNIAVFASGGGSNAEHLMLFFKEHPLARVTLVLSNKPDAGVLEKSKKIGVNTFVFNRPDFYETNRVEDAMKNANIDIILLAGFLWLIPKKLLDLYPKKIINIHPSLLPHFGGKGMHGPKIHDAVIAAGEKESGMTIHYVNERFDEGEIIFQGKYTLVPGETAESLSHQIWKLEIHHYPRVVEKLIAEGRL